jgi:hypothetical protein
MDEHDLRAALVDHEINFKGAKYRAALDRMRTDPPSSVDVVGGERVDLYFTAAPIDRQRNPFPFELHIGRSTLDDRPHLLSAFDGTVIAILDGRLPPGARELL